MKFNTTVLAAVLAAVVTGGCAMSTRSIAEIKQYPGRYDHRSVAIEGRVTQSFSGPLVPVSYYKVDDGTGELTVVGTGPAPKAGSVVRVKGRVGELASFGTRTFGLHLDQDEVTVRHR